MNGEYEDLYINSRAYQFDVSAVTGTITSVSVAFTGVQHAQLHGAGFEQSNEDSSTTNLLPPDAP